MIKQSIIYRTFLDCLYDYYLSELYEKSDFSEDEPVYVRDDDKAIYNLLNEIRKEQMERRVGFQVVVEAKLKELMAVFFRKLFEKNADDLSLSHKGIALQIAFMLDQNYKNPPEIEALAEQFNFSASSLRRIFKNEIGVSVWKYVQHVRMRMACKYFNEEKLSVEAVMEKIGMSDKKQFYELFKRETGVTPKEYKLRGGGGG